MSVIRLKNVSKRFEGKQVLRDVNFRLEERDRVGLIGNNGSGKTTILRMILGKEEPTDGTIEIDEGLTLGYFSQFSELSGDLTITETLNDLFSHIHDIESNLRETEEAMGQNPESKELDQLMKQYDTLNAEMERHEGWTYQNRIDTVLSKLGFNERHRNLPINQLSGGWRNRAALAKILLEIPDVLLLDEPTNFLDVEGLTWLEGWIDQFRGAVILVSHDRDFLDKVVLRVLEIENYRFHEYEGGFVSYIQKKRVRSKQIDRQFQFEEELLVFETEAILDREELAKNPNRGLNRKLANIKKEIAPREVDQVVTSIYERIRPVDLLCEVQQISKGYDDDILFRDLGLEIHRGDRVAVVGPNGCGKTTLMKVLREELPPDDGRIIWKVGDAYIDYNTVLESLDPDDSVTHLVNILGLGYAAGKKQVNRFLQMLQFSEMDLGQKIGTLSGGQRARVALAVALLSGSPAIILDEPTNHLDMKSTQVMERALAHFPGAVIVVSHDRFFIDKVATRLIVFKGDAEVEVVNGNWTTWTASQT
jgi:ATPase subunit of ABC transporter with duplicated ATPase domains